MTSSLDASNPKTSRSGRPSRRWSKHPSSSANTFNRSPDRFPRPADSVYIDHGVSARQAPPRPSIRSGGAVHGHYARQWPPLCSAVDLGPHCIIFRASGTAPPRGDRSLSFIAWLGSCTSPCSLAFFGIAARYRLAGDERAILRSTPRHSRGGGHLQFPPFKVFRARICGCALGSQLPTKAFSCGQALAIANRGTRGSDERADTRPYRRRTG